MKLGQIKDTRDIHNDDYIRMNQKIKSSLFKNTMDKIITTTNGKDYIVNKRALEKHKIHNTIKVNDNIKKNSRLIDPNKVTMGDETINSNDPSSKCIVAITEAPDQNIIDWSTRTYVIEDGPIRKQINTGVHSDLTWKSVLFQILIAFAVMHNKKIAINEFSWEKNIFIKTFKDTGAVGYWRYKINDIDFYVPNMGALVIIDSSYASLKDGITDKVKPEFKFRLVGDFCPDPSLIDSNMFKLHITTNTFDDVIKDMFKKIFSPDIGTSFKIYGGMVPGDDIIHIINEIYNVNFLDHKDTKTDIITSLTDTLINQFGMFLHNKLGDIVDQTDLQQLREPGKEVISCKKGELVAYRESGPQEIYKWGIISNPEMANLTLLIIENKIYQTHNTAPTNIRRIFGDITQKYKPDHKLNSNDELLETYNIIL